MCCLYVVPVEALHKGGQKGKRRQNTHGRTRHCGVGAKSTGMLIMYSKHDLPASSLDRNDGDFICESPSRNTHLAIVCSRTAESVLRVPA